VTPLTGSPDAEQQAEVRIRAGDSGQGRAEFSKGSGDEAGPGSNQEAEPLGLGQARPAKV